MTAKLRHVKRVRNIINNYYKVECNNIPEDIKTKNLSQANLNNLEATSDSKTTDVADSGIESVFTTILNTIGLGSKDSPRPSNQEDDEIYQKIDTTDNSKILASTRSPDDLYTHQCLSTNNKNTLNSKEEIQKIEDRIIDEDDEISYKHTADYSETPASPEVPDDLYTSQPSSIDDKESLNTEKSNEYPEIDLAGNSNQRLLDELIDKDNIDSNIPKSDYNYNQNQASSEFVVSLFGYDFTLNKENHYDPQEVKEHIYASIGLSISLPATV